MNQLSFLIDLLLNHKLSKLTKDIIIERIRDIESELLSPRQTPLPKALPPHYPPQAASTLAALEKHGLAIPGPRIEEAVEVIAQTPAAAQAMASRQQAINESIAGKVDKLTGRPRKF